MKLISNLIVLASALSLATVASATTCATNTWCFGSNPTTVSDGATYSTIGGSTVTGTVTVFGEQVTNNSSGGTYYSANNSTIDGLFSTNDSVFDEGIGIAPYDPAETNFDFSNQDGITDSADGSSTKGNVLVLELGSNIAKGTTLNFLIQAGINANTDVVSDYWQDGGVQNQNVSPASMTLNGTTTAGQISTNGTTAQSALTLTKNTSGIEWVAIEADCHYILLDTITGTPGTATPEPRFYGLLLAGLLAAAGMVYQKRRAAQANA
ncbi:MAG: hypothetical protein ACLPWF_31890 [Bryobacteraceae bacterium]